ncbi:MAG TPA: phosphatase PAP2 family protein [Bryobacteraceae bacterium]|nr:phosphatase PAP2 family protein [Bryobacteraceae bacterium]
MAELLKPSAVDRRFWPVDKLILGYFVFTSILLAGWWRGVQDAGWLAAAHVGGAALLLVEIKIPNRTSWYFRCWYPLPYVAACYKEMALLIPAVRHSDADRWLAEVDFRFWGAHPTIWLERIYNPALTEYLQTVYTLFVPAVLLVAFLLWRQRRYGEFQYIAFLIAMGFLASYVGYLLVPARGPRFLLKPLEHLPLRGLWLFANMQQTLDRLESAHYDCFPSGHTELTILACWMSRLVSNRLFWVYFCYTLSIIFATVYLRYHYTVDLLAGAALAVTLILAAPFFYRILRERA